MGSSLTTPAVLDFGIQAVVGVVAIAMQTEKFYDLTGSGTFVALAIKGFLDSTRAQAHSIQASMVVLWGIRLGSFLFKRVLKSGTDRRFNKARTNPPLFAFYWLLQGVWVFASLYPTLILLGKRAPVVNNVAYAGWALWVIGFLFEAVADKQKTNFRAKPENKGRYITQGLWSISRHPNYFGEIVLWLGLWLASLPSLSGWEHTAVVSPAFVAGLLIKVSGIPILERHAQKKWGGEKAFQDYVRTTAKLIPYVW
eukprot:m.75319 g.75319  ORF g.75319 m.75319 type:complete len:254 (+) comp14476_c1_seq2:412-1173(+)